jgi:hypothetical protein
MESADLLQQFIDQLSEKDRQSYEIAKSHLGMSFQLEKSVEFLKWKKQQQTEVKSTV